MCQKIRLVQSGYFGSQDTIILERPAMEIPWTVRHQHNHMPGMSRDKNFDDVTVAFDPDELSRMVDELRILDLRTAEEMLMPRASVMAGLEYSILIETGQVSRLIYYYEYHEQMADFLDVQHADRFWNYLKSRISPLDDRPSER